MEQSTRPRGTGAEYMAELSKRPGYKPQEAEDRNLQTLMALPKMERAAFMAELKAKPAVMPKAMGVKEPHHENYTLPGGTNYREILLQQPEGTFPGVPEHFGGTANVLASIRAKDRVGPNGEKILHLEEIQSDWHQQGREKGYKPKAVDLNKMLDTAKKKHTLLYRQLYDAKVNIREAEERKADAANPEEQALHDRMLQEHQRSLMDLMPQVMRADDELHKVLTLAARGVPDAPFKKDWHELALKKMIHHAATNGYDQIAITPGAEQANRYGLAKKLRSIEYSKGNDGKYHVIAIPHHGGDLMGSTYELPEIERYVGKDLTKQIAENQGEAHPYNDAYKVLSGQDLNIGGEGMKGFYDRMVPAFLNKFGKKHGVQVQPGQINIDDPNGHSQVAMLQASGIPETQWGQIPYKEKERMMAEYSAKQPPEMAPVHTFNITPQMREDVMKNGIPLYAKGGSVEENVPRETTKAYKLFRVHPKHPGKLFPLFVDANTPVEMGKWINAKEGEMAQGKVKSKIGPLAYRPGWHAGDLPIATHIGEKSDPTLTAPDLRPENHAWAEVEMPNDVDWQTEATKRGTNAQGKLVPVKAHITDQIPVGGHYRYKTNPNMTGNWLIGGSMKVNRVLNDKEVSKINKAAGLADLPRAQPFNKKAFGFAKGGTVGPEEFMAEEHVNHMADGGSVSTWRNSEPHPENDLLQPIGASKMVGDEKLLSQDNTFSHGLSEFTSSRKSYRYLYHGEDNNPIGSMQIQTSGPRSKKAVIQNLYVSENNRRQGIASKLLKRARQDFDVKHSTDLTSAGRAFAAVVKAAGGAVKGKVTISPNMDVMQYELLNRKAK
jgi:predicted GNAT family acetyltransferase